MDKPDPNPRKFIRGINAGSLPLKKAAICQAY